MFPPEPKHSCMAQAAPPPPHAIVQEFHHKRMEKIDNEQWFRFFLRHPRHAQARAHTHADPKRKGVSEGAGVCGVWGRVRGKVKEISFYRPNFFLSFFTTTFHRNRRSKIQKIAVDKKYFRCDYPPLLPVCPYVCSSQSPGDRLPPCLVRVAALVHTPPHKYPPAPKNQISFLSSPLFFWGESGGGGAHFEYLSSLFTSLSSKNRSMVSACFLFFSCIISRRLHRKKGTVFEKEVSSLS